MFVGRLDEIKKLNNYYTNTKNSSCIMYSIKGMGKTELINAFIADKQTLYHTFDNMTSNDIKRNIKNSFGSESLYEVIVNRLSTSDKKLVVVLEEFQYYILENKEEFIRIFELVISSDFDNRIMLVCTSSSVKWIENDMALQLGILALKFDEIFKLKEFSMLEIMSMFPEFTLEDAVKVYSVYGGIPGVLELYDSSISFIDNIKKLFKKNGVMSYYPEFILKKELRELSQYNSLLLAMANGCIKLNDIYARTGFSRAKISVYIKNLIDIDIVEKVFSYNGMNNKNSMKGLYRIKNPFLYFYYRYIMLNQNAINSNNIENIVEQIVNNQLIDEYRRTYDSICMDYLKLSCKYKKTDFNYSTCSGWYGKSGDIPIVLADDKGRVIIGFSKWDEEPVDIDDIKKYKKIIKSSKAAPIKIYVFSKEGFTKQVIRKYKNDEIFVLIDNNEL